MYDELVDITHHDYKELRNTILVGQWSLGQAFHEVVGVQKHFCLRAVSFDVIDVILGEGPLLSFLLLNYF